MRLQRIFGVMAGFAVVAAGARAESADVTGDSARLARPADSENVLQEITVTAQRREEGVQHAALGIDVISQNALSLSGSTRASDIGALVPALQIGESGNSQQSLYLRSVGSLSAQSYSDPAIAFNVDGVALARTSSMSGVLYDLARVEVLKGPQGTLYGRNATGGAINVVPNLPKIGETSGTVALTVGNYAEVHPEAEVNLAVSDSSAARLAFTYNRHDGYQTDGTGDANGYAGRVQYLYLFGDDLSVRVSGDYAHDGGHGFAGTTIAIQNPFTGAINRSPLPRDAGNLDARTGAIYGSQYTFISGRFLEPIYGAPKNDNNYWGVLTEINWKNPLGTLTILPAHRESNLDDFTTGFSYGATAVEHDEQSSVEARLTSNNEGLVRWLVGAYFFHETIDATYQFNQEALAPIQTLDQGTISKAGFGRITLAPLEDFRISIGARYTSDEKTFNGLSQTLLSVCAAPAVPIPACPGAPLTPNSTSFASSSAQLGLFPIIPNALYGSTLPGAANSVFPLITKPIVGTEKFTRTTYHAGIEYDLGSRSLLYASWDTGYHAGGFAFAEIKPNYAPEYLSAYSLGSKNQFLNDTVQFNAELFYWKYTNQQISHGGSDLDGTYVFYTDNAGASTIKGGEFSVKYLVTPHTTFDLDAQYLGSAYTRFTYQTPAGGTNAPPVTACPFAQTDAKHYTINCEGKTPQQAPKWSGNIGLQQRATVGNFTLTGEISAHAQTDSIVGFELIPVEVQKTYGEGNLSVGISPSSARWSAVAFVDNFTNKRPYGDAYYNSVNGIFASSVAPPRTAGLRVAAKF